MTNHSHQAFRPSDYESIANNILDPAVLAYIAGGAGNEITLNDNTKAFDQIALTQHVFGQFEQASTKTTLLGQAFRHPILLAPVAAQSLVNPEGEIATAQAANALEAGMILSTLSSKSLTSVANAIDRNKWFQLYFQKSKNNTLTLLRNAAQAGYEAIVVTLDTPIQSMNIRAQAANFQMPAHALPVNLPSNSQAETIELTADESVIFQGLMRSSPTLDDIQWLIAQTQLPVLVKGVMAHHEITQLKATGVKGFIVSNHGGRALDGTPASIKLLPAIRALVGPTFPLLLDSGIRSGYDVFKALALGADAVCIGRLQMYALAANGAQGVAHLLKLLRDELELCMALTGCNSIDAIDSTHLFLE